MLLAYAAMAIFVLFGIYSIVSAFRHKDGKHDWIPTRTGGMIGAIALILCILAGFWLVLKSLLP